MSRIPALRYRRKNHEFKVILVYIAGSRLSCATGNPSTNKQTNKQLAIETPKSKTLLGPMLMGQSRIHFLDWPEKDVKSTAYIEPKGQAPAHVIFSLVTQTFCAGTLGLSVLTLIRERDVCQGLEWDI